MIEYAVGCDTGCGRTSTPYGTLEEAKARAVRDGWTVSDDGNHWCHKHGPSDEDD